MAIVDLIVALLVLWAGYEFLTWAFSHVKSEPKPKEPLTGQLADLEAEALSAAEDRKKASEKIQATKEKVKQTLDKVQEIDEKL